MTGKFSSKPQIPVTFGKAACLNKCVFNGDTTLEKLDHFNLMFSTEVKQIQIFHFPLIEEQKHVKNSMGCFIFNQSYQSAQIKEEKNHGERGRMIFFPQ